ncbi:MAG: hypothetical protein PVI75_01925 [Gammaproteobacteria bacterium]|jgi:hypothetical protein
MKKQFEIIAVNICQELAQGNNRYLIKNMQMIFKTVGKTVNLTDLSNQFRIKMQAPEPKYISKKIEKFTDRNLRIETINRNLLHNIQMPVASPLVPILKEYNKKLKTNEGFRNHPELNKKGTEPVILYIKEVIKIGKRQESLRPLRNELEALREAIGNGASYLLSIRKNLSAPKLVQSAKIKKLDQAYTSLMEITSDIKMSLKKERATKKELTGVLKNSWNKFCEVTKEAFVGSEKNSNDAVKKNSLRKVIRLKVIKKTFIEKVLDTLKWLLGGRKARKYFVDVRKNSYSYNHSRNYFYKKAEQLQKQVFKNQDVEKQTSTLAIISG